MLSATRTVMKNGRRAMIGSCACCGTKMYVAGVWEGDSSSPAPLAASAAPQFPPIPKPIA